MIRLIRLDSFTTTNPLEPSASVSPSASASESPSPSPSPGAGDSTGSVTSSFPINGYILGVYIDYSSGQPDTTDITVSTAHSPVTTILTVSNNNVDGWYYPRHQVHSTDGTGLTYSNYESCLLLEDGETLVLTTPSDAGAACEPVGINDYVTVSAEDAGDGETIQVSLVVEV
jgi:hypothetical protein